MVPHLAHFLTGALDGGAAVAVKSCPQFGQNFEVDGMWAWQFGHTISATDMPAPEGVV